MYIPSVPFTVPMKILIPTWSTVGGVRKKTYPDINTVSDDKIIFVSFRSFGGTDVEKNGVLTVEKTAVVETWYRPDITSDCRLAMLETDDVCEILGEPEDIEMRHQYMKMKVRSVGGRQ